MNHLVQMYTDGSCLGNPGPGGWGVVLLYKGHIKELSGGEVQSTNNRMELTAVINGFAALKRPSIVDVITDSMYVKDGITTWLARWKKNNWRGTQNKKIANADLWQDLYNHIAVHETVTSTWVQGHAITRYNNIADLLAREQALYYKYGETNGKNT